MLLADSMTITQALDLSGPNQLFLDPDYSSGDKFDPSCDFWSIGAILYTLVTGGATNLAFDFQEAAWSKMNTELRDFVEKMLVRDLGAR